MKINGEKYIGVKTTKGWIPCMVVDLLPPTKQDNEIQYNLMVLPFSEISTRSLECESTDVSLCSPEMEQELLDYSLSHSCYPNDTNIMNLTIRESVPLSGSSSLKKYYRQRYHLFSRWDQGIVYDDIGLYSVTPEPLALHTAIRCSCGVAIDAFAGIGGNAIQLARTCNRVIAIDLDMQRIRYLQMNSAVYGVENKIDCICGDSLVLLPSYKIGDILICRMHADVVLLAPPWGGVDYAQKDVFHLDDFPVGLNGKVIFETARRVTRDVVFVLPRTSDRREVAELADEGEMVEFVEGSVDGHVKMVMAYFGSLVKSSHNNVRLLI